MKIILIILIVLILFISISFAQYQHEYNPMPPVFIPDNFLRIQGIEQMDIDFAIAWTDSVSMLFLRPYDAVILHVTVDQMPHDVFIFSDLGMQRLSIWMCSPPDAMGHRIPERIAEYCGEDCDGLKAPAGMTTNAKNREFDPENDLIYMADRGNDRVLELSYTPDTLGGQIHFNRAIGQGDLEWPNDVAIATYGSSDPSDADLFVVDWGHAMYDGELLRFGLDSSLKGQWSQIPQPPDGRRLFPFCKCVSIECFPDSITGFENIYISETKVSKIFHYIASSDSAPEFEMMEDLEVTSHWWQSGGVACDDYGRVYICNTSVGSVEMWEPGLGYPYETYGRYGRRYDAAIKPTNIVFDTYYGVCEALIFENYTRNSGLRTYLIDGGSSLSKPQLGFVGGNLVKPLKANALQIPQFYTLEPAYPNPFNSDCLIRFSLPHKSRVTLDIFNILGQKVSRLLDEEKEPGNHAVQFNAKGLSSGTYFYKMNAGDFSATKMVVLIK